MVDPYLLHSIESFPPLNESINKFNLECSKEHPDYNKISAIIEADPILYTDILRFANAPMYGLRNPVTSIRQAISLFSLQRIRGMALSAAIKANPFSDLHPYGLSVPTWFGIMERQQRFLSEWIIRIDRSLFLQLGAVIFILEIGRLAASYVLIFSDNPYRFTKISPFELVLEERNIIGASGDELAAMLFESWSFHPSLIDFIRFSLSPELSASPKIAAMLTCARLLFPCCGASDFASAEEIISQYGYDRNLLFSIYETIIKD
ncbi:MAG: HDOD domain-containing protein [Sulfuricurvum sp.]